MSPINQLSPFILDFCISTRVLGMQQGTKVYYLDQVMLKDIAGCHTISSKVRDIIAPGVISALPIHPILFLHTPPADRNSYYMILLNLGPVRPRGGIRIWKILPDAFIWMDQGDTPQVREIDWVKACGLEKHCLIYIHIMSTPI